jgi:hypothetical protein
LFFLKERERELDIAGALHTVCSSVCGLQISILYCYTVAVVGARLNPPSIAAASATAAGGRGAAVA